MSITQKSIKLLWSNAAGRCSFTDCQLRLTSAPSHDGLPFTLGEMAHIRGDRQGANRYDARQTQRERDDYANLILLCPTHHTLIDKPENAAIYSVEALFGMKHNHEDAISRQLAAREYATKQEAAQAVLPLMAKNRAVFDSFGPHSEAARRNPQGGGALQSWVVERAGTIVPNNRLIASIVNSASGKFSGNEQRVIATFMAHFRSYERWVNGETNYEGVVRFPPEFEQLMMESANARA
ncbi:MAG: HNH endonuclease [Verrucomicrobiaceae bacterium]|nr:MAG: HNH endonuclease [Verrucomicrobiaceae bacterium]